MHEKSLKQRGWDFLQSVKQRGQNFFWSVKQRGRDFFLATKQRGHDFFIHSKQRGHDFFGACKNPTARPRIPINFDGPLIFEKTSSNDRKGEEL